MWRSFASSLHGGLLRCLLNVGHLETALHRAMGLVTTRRELSTTVTPFAVEAAWRLGRWSALEELICLSLESARDVGPGGGDDVAGKAVALGRLIGRDTSKEYELQLGTALLALHAMACELPGRGGSRTTPGDLLERSYHRPAFLSAIREARADVVGSLAAASMESYHRYVSTRVQLLPTLSHSLVFLPLSPQRLPVLVAPPRAAGGGTSSTVAGLQS